MFRLLYGGSVNAAAEIPGAVALGLPEKRLVQASRDLILAHPCWQDYWDDVGGQAINDKIVRNYNGRARRLLSDKEQNRFREGVNFPIQSLVSDLLNRTVIAVAALAPWARFCYSIHDSFFFACPIDKRQELSYIIKQEATRDLMPGFGIPFDAEMVYYSERFKRRKVFKI